mmetsp:Transcript_44560/g.90961  ORF Transcript_44560/g.90961 Transcript_44560/m.90961 type:complete len:290 (-) Transcript_44560:519-1388(-)
MDLHDGDEGGIEVVGLGGLAVEDLHGVRAPRYCEHRAPVEVLRVLFSLHGGGSDNELEGGAADGSLLHEREQHVCVDCALVRLVKHDDGVGFDVGVDEALAQQHPVCHVLDGGLRGGAVLETDRVPHLLSEAAAELLSDALGDGHGRHPPRLRDPDPPCRRVPGLSKVLGHLRRLPRPCLSYHDEDLVLLHALEEGVPELEDGQPLPLLLDRLVRLPVPGGGAASAHGLSAPLLHLRRRRPDPRQLLGEHTLAGGSKRVRPGTPQILGCALHESTLLLILELTPLLGEC